MEFDYDSVKSVANKHKHGIDFTRAQAVWYDPSRVEVRARTEDEPRWLVIGCIEATCYSAIVTYRDERVRIISVRRSRKEEVAIYEG
ncbi:MAG: BrnT family toxin [Nocardioidaceae bacterium]